MDNVHLSAFEFSETRAETLRKFPSARIFRNTLYFLVGVMLSAVSILSYADSYPGVSGWKVIGASLYFSSAVASCQAYTYLPDFAYSHNVAANSENEYCYAYRISNPAYKTSSAQTVKGFYCPAGGTLSGTSCINASACPDGQVRDVTGQCGCPAGEVFDSSVGQCVCVPGVNQGKNSVTGSCYNCPAAGTSGYVYGATGIREGTGNFPPSICHDGCVYDTGGVGVSVGSGSAARWATGVGNSQGISCTSGAGNAPVVQPESPAAACVSQGMAYGTVNGVVVCVTPSSSQTNTSASKTTTPSAGGSSSVGTSTNTTCSGDGSCTTTTTTTTTSGGSGPGGTGTGSTSSSTTTSDTKSKSDFCEVNPKSSLCSGVGFSGTCDAEPACEGDAVQCVQAKEVFKLRCQNEQLYKKEPTDKIVGLFDQDTPGGKADFLALSEKALNKNGDGDLDIWAKFQENQKQYINISGTCPASNLHFSFKGHDFDLSQHTDMVCQLGQFVKLLIHIMAYMVVLKMILKPLG